MARTEGGGGIEVAVPGRGLCFTSGAMLCGRTAAREGDAATVISVLTAAAVVGTGLEALTLVALTVVGTCEFDLEGAALLAGLAWAGTGVLCPLVTGSSFLSSAGVPRGAGDPLAPRCSTGFGLGALSLIFG